MKFAFFPGNVNTPDLDFHAYLYWVDNGIILDAYMTRDVNAKKDALYDQHRKKDDHDS